MFIYIIQGFFQGWGVGGICPLLALACTPLDILRILFYMQINSSLYKIPDRCKLCLCKNSPIFHQIVSDKRSKIKFSRGEHAPGPPYFAAGFACGYVFAPPPWAKSWKKPCYIYNNIYMFVSLTWVCIVYIDKQVASLQRLGQLKQAV